MRRSHLTRRAIVAGVVSLGLIASACGGDDDGDTTTVPATDAPAETTAPDAGGDAGGDGAAMAQARVDAFSQAVTELPFNEPLTEAPGAGTVFYVQCSVSACAEIAIGIEAAAEAIGWEYQTVSHQDTPETVASAFDAAIAAQPDVVLTSGNPREWFAPQLETLESAGIPVVAWSIPEGYEPGEGISVNLLTADDYYFYGVLMADYAAVNSANKNILFVGLPVFPVLSLVQQGFQDEIAKVCPDCTVDVMEAALTDLGVNLPGQIVSKLQANTDLDFVVYAFGGMLFGVPDAVEAAGLGAQAKAISQAGGPLNFGFIAAGQHQVAEVGLASELFGWRAIDAAARILQGQGPGSATPPAEAQVDGKPDILVNGLPLQILEADDIDDPTVLWPGVPGFQEQFTALWGG